MRFLSHNPTSVIKTGFSSKRRKKRDKFEFILMNQKSFLYFCWTLYGCYGRGPGGGTDGGTDELLVLDELVVDVGTGRCTV